MKEGRRINKNRYHERKIKPEEEGKSGSADGSSQEASGVRACVLICTYQVGTHRPKESRFGGLSEGKCRTTLKPTFNATVASHQQQYNHHTVHSKQPAERHHIYPTDECCGDW